MMMKKSLILVLVAILGFPQMVFAQSLINTNTLVNNNDSLEITEDNLLLTQRKRKKSKRRGRRLPRRKIRRAKRRGNRYRRRLRRQGFRNSARRARVGSAAAGLIGVGIGAAIADSAREEEAITEAIIRDEADTLDDRDYYDDLYDTNFDGGYYDSDGFDGFDAGGFDDGF